MSEVEPSDTPHPFGNTTSPIPILLGVAERATKRGFANDLLGLTAVPILQALPADLIDFAIVLAIPSNYDYHNSKILISKRNRPKHQTTIELERVSDDLSASDEQFVEQVVSEPITELTGHAERTPLLYIGVHGSPYTLAIVAGPPMQVFSPEWIDFAILTSGKQTPIGSIHINFHPQEPLEASETRAFVASPLCPPVMVLSVTCLDCKATFKTYFLINPLFDTSNANLVDAVPSEKLPKDWKCSCGKVHESLESIGPSWPCRVRNWHAPDRLTLNVRDTYRLNQIKDTRKQYFELISRDPAEEDVQKFLQNHEEFWGFLRPRKILLKPKILTHKAADFGILTSDGTLFLIEIEKPKTLLSKQDGGQSSEMTAGLNQIADWRLIVQNHRLALLDELQLKAEEVKVVRFMLIAGRRARENPEALSARKNNLPPDTDFLAFDDLGSQLDELIRLFSIR